MRIEATVGDGSGDRRTIHLILTKKSLGSGVNGVVVQGILCGLGDNVAVKKLVVKRDGDPREVRYLKTLKHCNIVKMLYHFRSKNSNQESEYIVMECLPQTLYDMYDMSPKLSQFEIKLYMYQLIRSVAYIHNQGICHRDIKPGNLLIDRQTCVLKLCDFGLSTNLSRKTKNSTKVGSQEYHAPELLLGFTNYTNSVDVWAIGYIFVELLNGQQNLFQREMTADIQLRKMMNIFGTISEDFFPGMIPHLRYENLPQTKAKPWSEIISPYPTSDEVVSLCSGLLCYSPSSRLLPHEALSHKFFDELRSPMTTCLANGNPLPPLFNFQHGEVPINSSESPVQWNPSSSSSNMNEIVHSHSSSSIM